MCLARSPSLTFFSFYFFPFSTINCCNELSVNLFFFHLKKNLITIEFSKMDDSLCVCGSCFNRLSLFFSISPKRFHEILARSLLIGHVKKKMNEQTNQTHTQTQLDRNFVLPKKNATILFSFLNILVLSHCFQFIEFCLIYHYY